MDYWKSSKGTAARYVEQMLKVFPVDTDDTGFHQGVLIIPGKTDHGIWTVEGYSEDPSNFLVPNLVFTDTLGNKTKHLLTTNDLMQQEAWLEDSTTSNKVYEHA